MCYYVNIFLTLKVTNVMMLKGSEIIPSSCQVAGKYVDLDMRYIIVDVWYETIMEQIPGDCRFTV